MNKRTDYGGRGYVMFIRLYTVDYKGKNKMDKWDINKFFLKKSSVYTLFAKILEHYISSASLPPRGGHW